jgi:hypothetical protein
LKLKCEPKQLSDAASKTKFAVKPRKKLVVGLRNRRKYSRPRRLVGWLKRKPSVARQKKLVAGLRKPRA